MQARSLGVFPPPFITSMRQKYRIVVILFLFYVRTLELSGLLYPVQSTRDDDRRSGFHMELGAGTGM